MTSSRKPTQPDRGNGCYPRVRRKHRQAVTFRIQEPSTVALLGRVLSEACRRWAVVWAGSAETGARWLFGNTSGWRRATANRQVRLDGNEGGRDRGAPWKPVALERGARQSCSVALERVGTRSVVRGFGEKCRDRKGMTRLQHGGLGGKGGCQPNQAVVASACGWDCQSWVYRCRS